MTTAMSTAPITTTAWIAALLCASIMGCAIHRGATCTVAAVDEIVSQRRATKLSAMLEASLWVAGGLLLAQQLGAVMSPVAGHALTLWTLLGAALLGLGAFINRACVFGTLARLGNGEWAYLATPFGFYVGCLIAGRVGYELMPAMPPIALAAAAVNAAGASNAGAGAASAGLALTAWAWPAMLAIAAWAVRRSLRVWRAGHVWTPHTATAVIGLAFIALLLLVGGTWAYTDVLADWARGVMRDGPLHRSPLRLSLLAALFAGALLGGWRQRRWTRKLGHPAQWLRCGAGGALMGLGSVLIPGSNDGLILLGLPLLLPYAWAGFATMCGSIALALLLQRAWVARTRLLAARRA